MPRAKPQSSVSKNQMQLALALSSSLEESKKQELSKLTKELPASSIEDGTVPHNIKQMQKEFLERLQGPKPGPSKRHKRPLPVKPVPPLLARSSEERLRIITEKVSLVLIKDDAHSDGTVIDENNLKLAHNQVIEENTLWYKSCRPIQSSTQNCYYIDDLKKFISPSKVKMGDQFNDTNQVAILSPTDYRLPIRTEVVMPESSPQPLLGSTLESESSPQKNNSEDQFFYESMSEFESDWGLMVNNTEHSDVTIFVQGGLHLSAHKLVLCVRCPLAIFDLDTNNELHWISVPLDEAYAFLYFIYCGNINRVSALGTDNFWLVYLAKKYKVTRLLQLMYIYGFISQETSIDGLDLPVKLSKSGALSPDLFVDPEEASSDNMHQSIKPTAISRKPLQESVSCITISSDEEEDKLIQDFFGTASPIVCTSIVNSPEDISQEFNVDLCEPSSCNMKRKESFKYNSSGEKVLNDTLASPKKSVYPDMIAGFEERNDNFSTANNTQILERSCYDHVDLKKSVKTNRKGARKLSFPHRKKKCNLDASCSSDNDLKRKISQTEVNASSTVTKNTFEVRKKIKEAVAPVFAPSDPLQQSCSCGTPCKKKSALLDYSSEFSMKKSESFIQEECIQTPELPSLQPKQHRKPLDNVSTSSPITPMPDYAAMLDEQYEKELYRYGLKKGLPRNKGVKLLSHIYGKLHPIVEVVTLDGKDIYIPIDSTPAKKQLADQQPLSQSSTSSSSDSVIILEEKRGSEGEASSPAVSPIDLNTAIRTWITHHPEMHQQILLYDPICVDMVHDGIKHLLNVPVSGNQLIGALHEECVIFRTEQAQQMRTRKRKASKKRQSRKKKQNIGITSSQVTSPTKKNGKASPKKKDG